MQKIGLLLALVFFMPALFFSVYEISSLNRDEKMMQEVYGKQLEAILFSVNQYSDDVLNGWISKIENSVEEWSTGSSRLNKLLTFNPSLRTIFVNDSLDHKPLRRIYSLLDSTDELQQKIDMILSQSKPQINQLLDYKKSGFQKVEALNLPGNKSEKLQCLAFVVGDQTTRLNVVGLLIDAETFVQEVVGPRLQVIAKDQFILSVFRKGVNTAVYSTLPSDTTALAQTKDLWLFPDYTLGIRIKGSSLQELISKRRTTNLVLLVGLDLILVMAVILVFRNVKKEVQLAQNKSDFVSNVSHEIRTPLALISMFAETLEMGRVTSEEKKKEYYGIISKETHRLSGIVNKILNFSQAEANKKRLSLSSLHVSDEIREILNTYDFHLKNKGFEYHVTEKMDCWVKADREAFIEVVINLIDNAIKYSADQKQIEIIIGRENGNGFVAVKDQGIGINTMDQKHIFDKFYRVSTGDLAKTRGTGLGLSLVKQLMEAQQGRVTISSEKGKGSLFTLYFPLSNDKP